MESVTTQTRLVCLYHLLVMSILPRVPDHHQLELPVGGCGISDQGMRVRCVGDQRAFPRTAEASTSSWWDDLIASLWQTSLSALLSVSWLAFSNTRGRRGR